MQDLVDVEDLVDALEIGGTGMGLVFFTIVLFMILLVVLTRIFPGKEEDETPQAAPEPEAGNGLQAERRLAAAMGVGLALALRTEGDAPRRKSARPPSTPNAWKLHGREELMRSRAMER